MTERQKAVPNSANGNVFLLGVIFAPLFGFLITNSWNHNLWLSHDVASPIFDVAVFASTAGAISINRQRIASAVVYSAGARFVGIATGILAVLGITLVH